MLAVCLAKIFIQLYTVTNCEHCIRTVNGEECEVGEIASLKDKFAESERQDEGNAYEPTSPAKHFAFLRKLKKLNTIRLSPTT